MCPLCVLGVCVCQCHSMQVLNEECEVCTLWWECDVCDKTGMYSIMASVP